MTIRQIGKKLYALRSARGWSCRMMADKAGIAPNSVLNAEAGRGVAADILESMAKVLGAELTLATKCRKQRHPQV